MSQNRYEFKEKIGEGGLGEVYIAYDNQLRRNVAVKRVILDNEQEHADVESAEENLFKEATTLSSLQHPNILTVYDIGKDEKGYFVVMELIDGETFDDTIKRGALTLNDFQSVVSQTLEGIIAAHDVGLVHRDIKPSNIMISWMASGRFQLKILDFGLAKFSKTPSVQTMDQSNAIMGSIFFMAPEQFERKPLDQRVDIYSIGCIYYYCLTGEYPFQGESAAEVMASHLQHKLTHLKSLREDLPNYICNWVMRLLSREREDRPTDAKECLNLFLNRSSGIQQAKGKKSVSVPAPITQSHNVEQKSPSSKPKLITESQTSFANTSSQIKLNTGAQAVGVNPSNTNTYSQNNPYLVKKKSNTPLIVTIVIAALLIIGVGIYYFLLK